jgi:hypothetical protein
METIPTNHGNLTPSEIIDILTYSSYAYNRYLGMTHEQLINIGIGNEQMKLKYENESKKES